MDIIEESHSSTPFMDEVRNNIINDTNFDAAYIIMNSLSTIIACEGLFSNSTAVVIGAMLVATLLGPINGISLALVDGNTRLLKKALLSEIGGVFVVILIAFVFGKFQQAVPITPEIISRTKPNILDLIIALAGGAAGAYAIISPRVSAGMVGVAIATALVPPLSVCGICAARGDVKQALGGFLLFFANFIAIQAAAAFIFWINGFHRITTNKEDLRARKAHVIISSILLLAMTVIFGYNFALSVSEQRYQLKVREIMNKELVAYKGVYLADMRFHTVNNTQIITAVLDTPYSITPKRVAALQNGLPDRRGMNLELHVRSVLIKESTPYGYVNNTPDTGTPE